MRNNDRVRARWLMILMAAVGLAEEPALSDTALDLIRDGRSEYRIVVSDEARPIVRKAAEVLQDYLEKVTGVELMIDSLAPDAVLPAKSIVVDEGALAVKAGVDLSAAKLKYDGFVVRVAGDRLILAGVAQRGVLYAVMDFLEREVGCRWFSKQRVIVPQRRHLIVTVANRNEEPAFQIRMLYGIGLDPATSRGSYTTSMHSEDDPLRSDGNPHSFYTLAPPATYFKEHPDWYSNHNGVWFHQRGQLNYHNPQLVEHVRRRVVEKFKKSGLPNLNVTHGDHFGWSEDPVTNSFDAAEGSTSASHVNFVNKIAEAVQKEAPGRRIITLAYLYSHMPPRTLRYASNVVLEVCVPDVFWGLALTRSGSLGQRYLKTLRTWVGKSDMTMVWNYHQYGLPRYGISPDVAGLQGDYQAFRDAGAKGVFVEIYGGNSTPFDDLRVYLVSKLLWNPDLDFEALLRDFHQGYYGRAAGAKMLEFYHAVCDGLNTFRPEAYSDERLDKMERIVQEARPLAEDDFARRRIDKARRSVVFLRLAKLIGRWDVKDGFMTNRADVPQAEALRKQFNEINKRMGDNARLARKDQLFKKAVVELANDDLKLTVVPDPGGTIARIIDRKTGTDYAFIYPIRSSGKLIGGYQEWTTRGPFKVKGKPGDRSLTMVSEAEKYGSKVERTITVALSGTTFEITSRLINVSQGRSVRGLRTHPMVQVGRVEDCWFVYRTAAGKMVVKPVQPLECLSAGWGPTGMWAIVNPKTNTGMMWQSPAVHNGHFTWANSDYESFSCETFMEHANLEPGQTLEMTQTFTILRDVRRWCTENNVTLPPDQS